MDRCRDNFLYRWGPPHLLWTDVEMTLWTDGECFLDRFKLPSIAHYSIRTDCKQNFLGVVFKMISLLTRRGEGGGGGGGGLCNDQF